MTPIYTDLAWTYLSLIEKALSLPKPYRAGTETHARRVWNRMDEAERQQVRGMWS